MLGAKKSASWSCKRFRIKDESCCKYRLLFVAALIWSLNPKRISNWNELRNNFFQNFHCKILSNSALRAFVSFIIIPPEKALGNKGLFFWGGGGRHCTEVALLTQPSQVQFLCQLVKIESNLFLRTCRSKFVRSVSAHSGKILKSPFNGRFV